MTIFLTIPVFVPTSMSDWVFDAVGELEQALTIRSPEPSVILQVYSYVPPQMKSGESMSFRVFCAAGAIDGPLRTGAPSTRIVSSTVLRRARLTILGKTPVCTARWDDRFNRVEDQSSNSYLPRYGLDDNERSVQTEWKQRCLP